MGVSEAEAQQVVMLRLMVTWARAQGNECLTPRLKHFFKVMTLCMKYVSLRARLGVSNSPQLRPRCLAASLRN